MAIHLLWLCLSPRLVICPSCAWCLVACVRSCVRGHMDNSSALVLLLLLWATCSAHPVLPEMEHTWGKDKCYNIQSLVYLRWQASLATHVLQQCHHSCWSLLFLHVHDWETHPCCWCNVSQINKSSPSKRGLSSKRFQWFRQWILARQSVWKNQVIN